LYSETEGILGLKCENYYFSTYRRQKKDKFTGYELALFIHETNSVMFSSAMFSLIAAPSSLFTHQRSALLQGAVMVAPNVTLDRETTPVYTLTVNATDNVMGPGIKRSTVVSVSVIKSLLGQPNYFRHVCSGY